MRQQLILTTKIWKEGRYYIAYTPELEVASQGRTYEQVEKKLKEAVGLFLDTAKKMGTLRQVLKDSGFTEDERKWHSPSFFISSLEVKV